MRAHRRASTAKPCFILALGLAGCLVGALSLAGSARAAGASAPAALTAQPCWLDASSLSMDLTHHWVSVWTNCDPAAVVECEDGGDERLAAFCHQSGFCIGGGYYDMESYVDNSSNLPIVNSYEVELNAGGYHFLEGTAGPRRIARAVSRQELLFESEPQPWQPTGAPCDGDGEDATLVLELAVSRDLDDMSEIFGEVKASAFVVKPNGNIILGPINLEIGYAGEETYLIGETGAKELKFGKQYRLVVEVDESELWDDSPGFGVEQYVEFDVRAFVNAPGLVNPI